MNDLSSYVAKQGKNNFMEYYLNLHSVDYQVETTTYLANCYSLLEIVGLIPIYSKSSGNNLEIIGWEEIQYTHFSPCGVGCCIDYTNYRLVDGEIVINDTQTFYNGTCEPLLNTQREEDDENDLELRGGGDGDWPNCYQRCN